MSLFIGARDPSDSSDEPSYRYYLNPRARAPDPLLRRAAAAIAAVKGNADNPTRAGVVASTNVAVALLTEPPTEAFSDNTDLGASMRFRVVPVTTTSPPTYAIECRGGAAGSTVSSDAPIYISMPDTVGAPSVYSTTIGPNECFSFETVPSNRSYREKLLFNPFLKRYLCIAEDAETKAKILTGSDTITPQCELEVNSLLGSGPVIPGIPHQLISVFGNGKTLAAVAPTAEAPSGALLIRVPQPPAAPSSNLTSKAVSAGGGGDARIDPLQTITFEALNTHSPHFYRLKTAAVDAANNNAPLYININDTTRALSLTSKRYDEGNNFQIIADPLIPMRFTFVAVSTSAALRAVNSKNAEDLNADGTIISGEQHAEDCWNQFILKPIASGSALLSAASTAHRLLHHRPTTNTASTTDGPTHADGTIAAAAVVADDGPLPRHIHHVLCRDRRPRPDMHPVQDRSHIHADRLRDRSLDAVAPPPQPQPPNNLPTPPSPPPPAPATTTPAEAKHTCAEHVSEEMMGGKVMGVGASLSPPPTNTSTLMRRIGASVVVGAMLIVAQYLLSK